MLKVLVSTLKVGDVVLPPARELSLWMRRRCTEKGLPEAALNLTIKEIHEGMPDKGGPWIVFVCDQTKEWNADSKAFDFKFKARPSSLWALVSKSKADEIHSLIAEPNDANKRGELASKKVRFGESGRFAVYAIHTRFDAVEWFVADAEALDENELPSIVRQASTKDDALMGFDIS
jgi:hypothetical protein